MEKPRVETLGACRILDARLIVTMDIGAGKARSADEIVAWAVRPRETSPSRSSAEGAVDFENRPNPREIFGEELFVFSFQLSDVYRPLQEASCDGSFELLPARTNRS